MRGALQDAQKDRSAAQSEETGGVPSGAPVDDKEHTSVRAAER